MPRTQRNPRTAVLGGLMLVLVLCIVGLATRISVGTVMWVEERETPPPLAQGEGAQRDEGAEEGAQDAQHEVELSETTGSVMNIILVGALMLFVLVAALILNRKRSHSVDQEGGDQLEDVGGDARGSLRGVTAEAIGDALDDLATGHAVDHVVVECWRRLELAARAHGVEADASRTSSELAAAVLGRTAAPARDVEELAALYREVRYATTAPDNATQRARDALQSIQEAMR